MKKNMLKTMIDNKKIEIANRKLQNFSNPFLEKILHPKVGDISIIGEIKLKSPSGGILGNQDQILEKAKLYEDSNVDAISIVTDTKYFGGNVEMVLNLKKKVGIPILQKDFIIDPFQIHEAKRNGADAVLLIARICSTDQLQDQINLCNQLQIIPVIEIYDEEDSKKISATQVIGVNARNLEDFTINVEKACGLISILSKKHTVIGFSGVSSRKEVEMYKKAGAKAVLVGTELMKSTNASEFIKHLKGA